MSTLKTHFTIICYSFTFLVLLYAVMDAVEIFPPLSAGNIFLFMGMTVSIKLLIALTDKLPVKNGTLASLIRIADIIIVVFTLGILFELFPLDWFYILCTLGMILIIYFGVGSILMIKDQADANAINKQLRLNQHKLAKKGERLE
ncbi:DUF3021 family protein [Paenibacillaceae bacterium]|nr:DUF3021 family protein [Paenibacillaceae bacterium]